ncbi:MAG: type II CAAX endopeptidase family protein [Candidatus Acidiferrales bacterium]
MRRVSQFLRSVLPADLNQMVFLLGVVSLFIAPHLPWGPWINGAARITTPFDPRVLVVFALYANHFAATMGFFICFRPGGHPVRRVLCWVCLPAVMAEFTLIYCCFAVVSAGDSSAFKISNFTLRNIASFPTFSQLGQGFYFALIGFLLVAAFVVQLALGPTSLPLELPPSSVSSLDDSTTWKRIETFLWIFLALIPLICWVWLPHVAKLFPDVFVFSHFPNFDGIGVADVSSANFILDSVIIAIALHVIGKEAWNAIRSSLCWPSLVGITLAVAFPVGVSALISVTHFLALSSAARLSGGIKSPVCALYFRLPSIGLFALVPVALAEEVIFRGLLQPLFIRRYGLFRGIFLVGIVFAAGHLSADMTGAHTARVVVVRLCLRLIESLVLSFVFGWLTIRTGSVLPAALSHGLFNILGLSPFGPTFFGMGIVIDLLLAAIAFVLFRYWPVQAQTAEEFDDANTRPALGG